MTRIFIRPKASSDIDEQALFIAKDNLQVAYRFYEACDETFKNLAKMPQMGQRYPTDKKQLNDVRFFPILGFERHLVFYIPAKDKIDIVRILYATRDVHKILRKI
jgi:toxin ParE1/3/4